jgi:nitrite reductase (NADH) small subunit
MSKASSKSKVQWVDVGPLESIPIRGARVVKSAVGCIAVFRTAENQAFALLDKCPHKGGPLSNGIVHDTGVTCPLHNWVINLETGAALGADEGQTASFKLKIEKGRIFLDAAQISSRAAA